MSKLNVNLTQKKLSVNINKTGPKGDAGNDGSDGASSYTYVAYASDDQGTGFSLSPAANLTFIAVLTTDTEIASPSAGDFAGLWTEYKSDIQNFDDLTDVTITDGVENDLLTLESGVWVNKTRQNISDSFFPLIFENYIPDIKLYSIDDTLEGREYTTSSFDSYTKYNGIPFSSNNNDEIVFNFNISLGGTPDIPNCPAIAFGIDEDNYLEVEISRNSTDGVRINKYVAGSKTMIGSGELIGGSDSRFGKIPIIVRNQGFRGRATFITGDLIDGIIQSSDTDIDMRSATFFALREVQGTFHNMIISGPRIV